jgi:hypothetical protein
MHKKKNSSLFHEDRISRFVRFKMKRIFLPANHTNEREFRTGVIGVDARDSRAPAGILLIQALPVRVCRRPLICFNS